MQKATFQERASALVADLLICYSICCLILFVVDLGRPPEGPGPAIFWAMISFSLLPLLYWFAEVLFGKTVGKHILGLRVMHKTGSEATRIRLAARFIFKNLAWISIWFFSPFIYTIFDPGNLWLSWRIFITAGYLLALGSSTMTLHDRISSTCVFKDKSLGRYKDEPIL